MVSFDDDDSCAALAELDARYLAGEGAEHAAVLAPGVPHTAALFARDWDALLATMADDFVGVDHRGLWPDLDRDGYVARMRSLHEAANGVVVARKQHIASRAVLATCDVHATGAHGDAYAYCFHLISVTNDQRLLARFEYFDEDQFDAALARLDELATEEPRTAHAINAAVENVATRLMARVPELARTRQFESIADLIAADYVRIDHRTGIPAPTSHGPADFVAMLRATLDVGFDEILNTPLAVRGERLALSRVDVRAADGREIVFLQLHEWDASKLVYAAHYDESALADAVAELEERFIAGEGAGHEYEIRRVGDVARATQAHDPVAAYRALNTLACTVTDHRLLSWPTSTVSDLVDEIRADRGLSAPRTTVFASLEIRGDAVLITQDDCFVTPEGNEYRRRCLVVGHSVAGLVDTIEFFEPEQRDAARERFEALGAETRTPHVDNAIVRDLTRAVWREEFDPTFDQMAEMEAQTVADIVIDDRRRGVSIGVLRGHDEMADNIRAQDELFGPTSYLPIAVRGEHLALLRTRSVSETGFELVSLAIAETNTAGKYCAWTFFDEADLRLALETLYVRYDEIRVDAPGIAESGFSRERQAFERGDWDEVATCFAPDFVAIDHRPLGFAPATAEEYHARSRELVASVPELHGFARKSFFAPQAGIAVTAFLGTSVEGSEYEWNLVFVASADTHGRYQRIEYFPEEQWTEALARFDQLARNAEPPAVSPFGGAVRYLDSVRGTPQLGRVDCACFC